MLISSSPCFGFVSGVERKGGYANWLDGNHVSGGDLQEGFESLDSEGVEPPYSTNGNGRASRNRNHVGVRKWVFQGDSGALFLLSVEEMRTRARVASQIPRTLPNCNINELVG